jgi:hypothetical protein
MIGDRVLATLSHIETTRVRVITIYRRIGRVQGPPKRGSADAVSAAATSAVRRRGIYGGAEMSSAVDGADAETYSPWSVVNLVFQHLADEGLHPVLGESGDPGPPARALLLALGIEPAAEGNREVMRRVHEHLAELRAAMGVSF